MKTSAISLLLLLGVSLLLALSLGLACGGDGDNGAGEDTASPTASPTSSPTSSPTASPLPGITSGPLFDYLTSFLEIVEDAESGTIGAVERFNETSLEVSAEERIPAMQTYLSEIETVFTDAIDRLEALSVPDIAVTHHETFIEGARGSVDAGNSLRLELPDIETLVQLDERLAQFDAEVDAAVEISNAACLELQAIADAEVLAIDLDCQD